MSALGLNPLSVRVVKVGGSLFARPRLGDRITAWLDRQAPAVNILIAGGGELADVIRRWDAVHGLGEEASHWLCIRAISISAEVLAAQLSPRQVCESLAELHVRVVAARKSNTGEVIVFGAEDFLRSEEPGLPPMPVPHRWSVTTDSLAGRIAEVIRADELVLLKSALPPQDQPENWPALAAAGYVDEYFPTIAARLPRVRCDIVETTA